MSDLVEQLRAFSDGICGKNELRVGLLMCNSVMIEAADEIERLRSKQNMAPLVTASLKENERLRAELERLHEKHGEQQTADVLAGKAK